MIDQLLNNFKKNKNEKIVDEYLGYMFIAEISDDDIIDCVSKLMDMGYKLSESTPQELFKSRKIVMPLYRKTRIDYLIDRFPYYFNNNEIAEIMELGYKITQNSCSTILSNKYAFSFAVKTQCPCIINLYEGVNLSKEVLTFAFEKGYNIKTASLDFISRNQYLIELAVKYSEIMELSQMINDNFNNQEFLTIVVKNIPSYINKLELSDLKKQILISLKNINSLSIRRSFIKKIHDIGVDNLTIDKIVYFERMILRIENSNSLELRRVSFEIIEQLLNIDNPMEYIEHLEKIFLDNHLPYFEKVYLVFEFLHKDVSIRNSSAILGLTQNKYERNMIIQIDLLKCFIGSNNKNLKQYLQMMEKGSNIYISLLDRLKNLSYEKQYYYIYEYLYELQNYKEEYLLFVRFVNVFKTIVSEIRGKFSISNSLIEDIVYLKDEFNYIYDYILKKIFSRAIGKSVASFKDVLNIMENIRDNADRKGRILEDTKDFTLKKGDMIKGLGDDGIKYFSNILGNGSLCKEMLGANSHSDTTELDTDVSFIKDNYQTIYTALNCSYSYRWGPIWFVMNIDDCFIVTKQPEFIYNPKEYSEKDLRKNKFLKYELFSNGYETGGIRTGFPSSMVKFIIVDSYDERIGQAIAMNGFYIPVVDVNGRIVFSSTQYDEIRNRMHKNDAITLKKTI